MVKAIYEQLVPHEMPSLVGGVQGLTQEVSFKRGPRQGRVENYFMEFEVEFDEHMNVSFGVTYRSRFAFAGTIYECDAEPFFVLSKSPRSCTVRFVSLGEVKQSRQVDTGNA